MRTIDVAIIGGSLAGAACVRTLVHAGVDAVAIERDAFPREKVCGGFLSPGAVEVLEELDVLNDVRAAGAVEVRSARVRSAAGETEIAFRRPGLGVSRRTLDAVLGNHAAIEYGSVVSAERELDGRFRIRLGEGGEMCARVLIDAAGKLSKFGQSRKKAETSPQFGVQFYEPESRGDVMDFWVFRDGYGGTVGVEGGRSNSCFLIRREALPRYLNRKDCLVTGPVAYRTRESEFMAIGDAAGMIDPFCGEGMHHALDTGMIAAESVTLGLGKSWCYDDIRRHYEKERNRRWWKKRGLARAARVALRYPSFSRAAWVIDWFWGVPRPKGEVGPR